MLDNSESRLEALITIIDFNLGDALNRTFKECNAPLALLTHGHGTAKSVIYEILGYGDPKKAVSISIHTNKMSRCILSNLQNGIEFSKPGTGIAFTISLSSVSKALSDTCIEAEEGLEMGSDEMAAMSKGTYQLIIAIVNSGHFEEVMDAAKAAGALGGTVIHARSLGSKEAAKYLGITIQPEKELLLILTTQEKKRAIMESITLKAGINTESMGICFSLPVNDVLGFGTGVEINNLL